MTQSICLLADLTSIDESTATKFSSCVPSRGQFHEQRYVNFYSTCEEITLNFKTVGKSFKFSSVKFRQVEFYSELFSHKFGPIIKHGSVIVRRRHES